jgi:hypothetical protein
VQEGAHVGREQPSDGTDAEGVGLGQFARVDDKARIAEPAIEGEEIEAGEVPIEESGDDAALDGWIEERTESQGPHALHEDAMVLLVTGEAGGKAALELEFAQGLFEGEQGMRGGCESELFVCIEAFELAEEVEAQAAGEAGAGFEFLR